MRAYEKILQDMKDIVLEAAKYLDNREDAAHITVKGVSDYVTQVDLQVQQFIFNRLGEKYPDIQFVGEEKDNRDVDLSGRAWVLDPVDGTTNLIHDYHRSSISLALFEQREPMIGVVYQPYTKELFWAIKGQGAFLNDTQIHVSGVKRMEDALISIGTAPYHKKEYGKQTFAKIYRVFMDCQDIRRIGSAAIDFAEVAAGRIDAFFEEELKLWDYGAGKLLVEEAGGILTRMDGKPVDAAYVSDVLGATPEIHRCLVKNYLNESYEITCNRGGKMMTYEAAYRKLEKAGQTHVLQYFEGLSEEEKTDLLDQIDLTDFSVLQYCSKKEELSQKGRITPLMAMQLPEIEANRENYTKEGLKIIQEGKVGAVLLAGGMGTRLGSEDPKGMYNIGVTKDVYIFERLLTNLMDVVKQADCWIHLFIMTSDKNHEKTVAFLQQHQYFGYSPEHIHFFRQEMAPAADYEGKVYMESRSKISNSPNGNGGWFSSMNTGGMLEIVHQQGIQWLNVFAVDNVLQRIADPCFIGATVQKQCVAGAKVVRKNAPDEKVGVMCLEDGRPSIVEYYELTDELMNAKDENGDPAYNFGVILNYLFAVEELEKIVEKKMPLHIVEKKISYMNAAGEYIKPEQPNGYKFETLILDMIHLMDSCLPYEVVRNHEFAPIKNKTGVDSVESARALCVENGIVL